MAARPHDVGVLVFDGMKMLDLSGPAEVFAEANRYGARYRLSILSPDGASVRSSIGMPVPADTDARSAAACDTLVVVGGDALPDAPIAPALSGAARALAGRAGRVASVCTGAFVLAAAGLLEGRRATTHWQHTTTLARRCPSTRVEPDAIFVKDGATYTSAGVTAGIDLALALLEEDHGPDLARKVARSLVVHMQRAGGQSQFSASLSGPAPRTPVLRQVLDAVQAEPTADHSLEALAARVRVSARHLTRLFRAELDTTPGKYVELIRFDMAKALLDSGHSATEAAALSGFPSYESLRRAFARHLGLSPTRYRQRFATTAPGPDARPGGG
ncbi:GlxA family transcriptional regulator [Streptomyces mutabilis]|uniref:GlxA family transcriptional regulator n=1 Tax=Streptomyces TaxID=1883 RepID=UPI0025B61762|nr:MULTISPECIES: GlxA family transcriptional regulator [unclassified Streptomyces]MDN3246048.1 GlxA family transcriptional regulator [Streptomyces sp. ZSW22]MDN3257749.1 GlxA family transcriptional regulator [Streptomyces sp. MA25(2023)]